MTESLTPRESQVADGLAEGKPIKRVAVDLGISIYTARKHAAAVRRKLGATSQSQIVVLHLAPRVEVLEREVARLSARLEALGGQAVGHIPPVTIVR